MERNLQKKRLIQKLREKRQMLISKRTITFIHKSRSKKGTTSPAPRPAPGRKCGGCSRKARVKGN